MLDFCKNSAQEQAINTINGPVIIIACPGSGKTTTLIRRIHNMLDTGIKGENILMLTFSRDSAEDMKKRYVSQYEKSDGITFRTYHSLCLAVLSEENLYTSRDVIDASEVYTFIYNRLKDFHHVQDAADVTKKVVSEISYLKSSRALVTDFNPTSCEKKMFRDLYNSYEKMLSETHKIDYDDMLIETEKLFRENKNVLNKWQERFKYIQCDEYQDTNIIQRDIIYLLAEKYKNICVVGDDDQSIYGFRGAFPQVMFDFEKDFKNVVSIKMSTNYRSANKIVETADLLIKQNKKRFEKQFISYRGCRGAEGYVNFMGFKNREDEVDYVVRKIKSEHEKGIPYSEMAVIFRNNNLAGLPISKLIENQIPFKTKEKVESVYDKWVFKSLCHYIYLSSGQWKQSYIDTVINIPYKYLKTSEFKDCPYSYKDMISRLSYIKEDWRFVKSRGEISNIFAVFGKGAVTLDSSPLRALNAFEFVGIKEAITKRAESVNEDVEEAMLMFSQLEEDAAKFETIREWFRFAKAEHNRIEEINKHKQEENGVTITTMHGSKGCEWKDVFVIDSTYKIIPHRDALSESQVEEERRLFYVALTRAKDNLEVLWLEPSSLFVVETMAKINEKKIKKKKEEEIKKRNEKIKNEENKKNEKEIKKENKEKEENEKEIKKENKEKEENEKETKRLPTGTMVRHRIYGTGFIEEYPSPDKVKVSFSSGAHAFKYPQAFADGFFEILKWSSMTPP